jgi:GntR family transcriptional regulator
MAGLSADGPRSVFARPLYCQVRALLLARIEQGDWTVGQALPNELTLASDFGVSIGTVRRAIGGLEADGILIRKQGRGTYLARSRRDSLMARLSRIQLIDGRGQRPTFQRISMTQRRPTVAEAEALAITQRVKILHIEQTISAQRRQIGVERILVAANIIPDLRAQLQDEDDLQKLYIEHGLHIDRVSDVIRASSAPDTTAPFTGFATGSPFLQIDRIMYGVMHQLIEWRTSWFLAQHAHYANSVL